MPPTPTSETPPEPDPGTAAEEREIRAVLESYLAAITARDEPAAAQYTCRKEDGGYLWISSAGRRITVISVRVGGTMGRRPAALVEIEVDGRSTTPLVLHKVDGAWCVAP